MPEMVSLRATLISPLAFLTWRKPARMPARNRSVAVTNSGMVTKATRARVKLMRSMATRMKPTFSRSPATLTMPSAMNSRSASRSLERLVSVLPTGVLSK